MDVDMPMENAQPEQVNEDWFQEDEQVEQLDIAADNVAVEPSRHPQISMKDPATTLSYKPFGGSVEEAQADERFHQMEREIARYIWKDPEEKAVVQVRLAVLIDTLTQVEIRSYLCVPNASQSLKAVLMNRLDTLVRDESEKLQQWKKEKRSKD